jgi:type II secretory pathway component PulM
MKNGLRNISAVSIVATPRDFHNEHTVQDAIFRSARAHDVLIRINDGEVQVAAEPWVFDVLDASKAWDGRLQHALVGALLGYSADKVQGFLDRMVRHEAA